MSRPQTAGAQIIEEVTSWPGVSAAPGSRGELSLRFGRREIGHLHGDHAAHFAFPKRIGAGLREQGRVGRHPAMPDSLAWGARRIGTEADVRDVIELMRLNYDRVLARYGLPEEQGAEEPLATG